MEEIEMAGTLLINVRIAFLIWHFLTGPSMNKKEIKAQVKQSLEAGESKTAVFKRLSGQGMKDRLLAYQIASYPDPILCAKYRNLNRVAIALMVLQSLFAFMLGLSISSTMGVAGMLAIALFLGAIPLLFAWGFSKNQVGMYNAYILLTVIQAHRQIDAFIKGPAAGVVGLVIGVLTFGVIFYLRFKLFPDFVFMSPKKIKGNYVFTS